MAHDRVPALRRLRPGSPLGRLYHPASAGRSRRGQGAASARVREVVSQLTEAVGTLQQTAASLDRLVRQIEANPRAAVSKAPAAEKEIKP